MHGLSFNGLFALALSPNSFLFMQHVSLKRTTIKFFGTYIRGTCQPFVTIILPPLFATL